MLQDWFPVLLSLRVAALATLLAVAMGVPLAYWLQQHRGRGGEWVDRFLLLPLVLPPTVLGYYVLVLLGRDSFLGRQLESITGLSLVFTWQGAVLAALLHSLPFLVRMARAAFASVDPMYERAARSLGASELLVFSRVALPLAKRSIAAAATLSFARALGDFGITYMVAGNIPGKTQTAALAIYEAVEAGDSQRALVLVAVVTLLALLLLTLASRIAPDRDGTYHA